MQQSLPAQAPHPERVVIAPLDVVVLVSLERVHDDVGALAAVVDVAEDVQRIDAQTLDHVADGDDEFIGLSAEEMIVSTTRA